MVCEERQRQPDVDAPGVSGGRRAAALSGWKGFALAAGASLWLVFALWLMATGGPSAAGEPFRFTPPPEPTPTLAPTPAATAGAG